MYMDIVGTRVHDPLLKAAADYCQHKTTDRHNIGTRTSKQSGGNYLLVWRVRLLADNCLEFLDKHNMEGDGLLNPVAM